MCTAQANRTFKRLFEVTQSDQQMSRRRIVLVDNSKELLQMTQLLVEPEFEVVGAFTDAQLALNEGPALIPDILLLDISLGDVNGFELARRFRLLECPAEVVFFSSHVGRDFVSAAIEIGAAGYVFKYRAATDLVPALRQISAGIRFFPVGFASAF